MGLDVLRKGYARIKGFLGTPIGAATAGAIGGSVAGGTAVAGIMAFKNKAKKSHSRASHKSTRKIKHTSRGWAQDRRRRSKQKWEVAYWKKHHGRKGKKSRGKVHYARKTGQPYIILASGKAKFIKGKRRKM